MIWSAHSLTDQSDDIFLPRRLSALLSAALSRCKIIVTALLSRTLLKDQCLRPQAGFNCPLLSLGTSDILCYPVPSWSVSTIRCRGRSWLSQARCLVQALRATGFVGRPDSGSNISTSPRSSGILSYVARSSFHQPLPPQPHM